MSETPSFESKINAQEAISPPQTLITDVPRALLPAQITDPIIELLQRVPFPIEVETHPTTSIRHTIERAPTQGELEAGSAYIGEEGEFTDAARFMQNIEAYDPNRSLANPAIRKEIIMRSDTVQAKNMLLAMNESLYPTENGSSNLSEKEILLGSGEADDYEVGFIGISPEDVDEVLSSVLEGVRYFAEKDDLFTAGLLAANALVPLQMMKDGNKRTARAVFEMISFGYDGSHYDQAALRKKLGYTHQARASMYYEARDPRLAIAFQQEQLPAEQRSDFGPLSMNWSNFNNRKLLQDTMTGVTDSSIVDQVVNVLQQTGFGPRYVFEASDPKMMKEYAETRDPNIVQTAVAEFVSKIDDSKAEEIIAEDRKQRKKFIQRLVTSTTGENVLPLYYDDAGNPTGNFTANIAA